MHGKLKLDEIKVTDEKLGVMWDTVSKHGLKTTPLPDECKSSILTAAQAGLIHNSMTMKIYDGTDKDDLKEIGNGFMFGLGHAFIIFEGPDGELQVYEGRKRSFMNLFEQNRWLPLDKSIATLDPHDTLKRRQICKICGVSKA